jgi:hypothetical protein
LPIANCFFAFPQYLFRVGVILVLSVLWMRKEVEIFAALELPIAY